MMDNAPLNNGVLQDFLVDAQVWLTKSLECLQHLELIHNDPDACFCLNETLETLARRANLLGLLEVAHYTASLQRLLEPACRQRHLGSEALSALHACLNLLAWQLELVDASTGRLSLDTEEQQLLLGELADAVGQPLPELCGPCRARGDVCVHAHPTQAISRPSSSLNSPRH
ncbi:histidine kinase [Pseudomonas putida]|nr:histidine kinase [Pseudomonas putida]MEB3901345.1 histidine kinase [Pseudomonas putida]